MEAGLVQAVCRCRPTQPPPNKPNLLTETDVIVTSWCLVRKCKGCVLQNFSETALLVSQELGTQWNVKKSRSFVNLINPHFTHNKISKTKSEIVRAHFKFDFKEKYQWGHWLHCSVPSFSVLGFSCHLDSMCLLTWALRAIRRSRCSVVWRTQLQFVPKGIPLLTFWPSSPLTNSLRDHHVTDLQTFLLAPPTLPGFACPSQNEMS